VEEVEEVEVVMELELIPPFQEEAEELEQISNMHTTSQFKA